MTPEQAKAICIQAHKGQWRRPISIDYFQLECLIGGLQAFSLKTGLFEDNTYEADGMGIAKINNNDYLYSSQYSSHPIAVADMMTTDEEKVVAYLHDVIEDCEDYYLNPADSTICNRKGMNMYLGSYVFNALYYLTKTGSMSYDKYIKRISYDKLANKIKIADITHNLSCNPTDSQKRKYQQAMKILLAVL